MRFKRGSFSFRLFYISVIVGLVFALTSVFANNYFYNKIIITTVEGFVVHFFKYIEQRLEGSESLKPEDFRTDLFFSEYEFYRLAIYNESGEIIWELKGKAEFDERHIPDFKKMSEGDEIGRTGSKRYHTFYRKLKYRSAEGTDKTLFAVLSINISSTLNWVNQINRFRIVFFVSIILLLIVFVFFSTRHLVAPFKRLLEDIEKVSTGQKKRLDTENPGYDEMITIISNFNKLIGSLDIVRADLVSSEERLKTLLKKSRDIIIMLDERFRIEYASDTFKEITGVNIEKAEGRLFLSDFMPPEEVKKLLPLLRKMFRGELINDFEIRLTGRDRENIYLLASLITRDADNEDRRGLILFGKDITEHKKIEEALRKRTEALETILFSLSHDLKSPVFTLKGMALLFRNKYYNSLDEQGRHFIDRINENIVRMERMISHMLDISRSERQVFSTEDVNLQDIIQMIIEDMKSYIEECNARIVVEGNMPVIKGDKDKLYIVFKNLFENSLKYRNRDRELKILLKSVKNNQNIELILEDNGIGIESRYLDKLFRPFSRAVSQTENMPQGYGIGLAIVKGILDAHKAGIKVESSYGEWTRFRITFDKSSVVRI